MRNFLSIDWDFFSYSPHEMDQDDPDTPHTVPGTDHNGKAIKAELNQLLDWGGTEAHGGMLATIIWLNRIANAVSWGVEIRDVIGLINRGGNVMPQPFTEHVLEIWPHLSYSKVYYGDSHAMALFGVNALHTIEQRKAMKSADTDDPEGVEVTPIRVVHFDAHHDMGYDAEQVYGQQRQGSSDCASWLWHMIDLERVAEVMFVMPNWTKGYPWTRVLEGIDDRYQHIEQYLDKIVALTWDEWVATDRPEKNETIDGAYVCRSGTWVPPWLDNEFLQFVKGLTHKLQPYTEEYCAEHNIPCIGVDITERRDWNWNVVHQHADALRRMRSGKLIDTLMEDLDANALDRIINKGENLERSKRA